MSWLFLIIAGIGEVVWAYYLAKQQYILYIIFMGFTMFFTSVASKTLPISIVYPVLIGIGTLGIILVSIIFFKENITFLKLLYIFFILIGVIGLKTIHV